MTDNPIKPNRADCGQPPTESDDADYARYVRARIERGKKAADAGRVVPHEVVRRRFLSR